MTLGERITIVSICDNHYMKMLAALMKSIEINYRSHKKIDYYIVEDNVKDRNKVKLQNSVNSDLINLHWIKMSEAIPSGFKFPLDYSSFPLNIYIRLFIPHFIPVNTEKVLYLDVDMIVLEDISKLWEISLANKVIAGVIDRSGVISSNWLGIQNYKALNLPPDTKYFNSGLLLIDTIKWRKLGLTHKIVKCIQDNIEFADFPDQYGLNVVFANEWTQLDSRWNSQSVFDIKNPFIMHFTGRKPIYKSYNYNQDYKNEFLKYLKLTEWGNYKPVGEYQRLLKKLYNKFEKKMRFIR